jgi:Spy/CpxP family protein refolding chaperone
MKYFMISVALFVLVSVSTVSSGPMCGVLVKHPELADRVGLTEEQRAELEELFVETEQRIISSEAEIKLKQLEIDRHIGSDKPDMRQIRKLVNEAGDARSSVRLAHIERDVRARQVLRPEQAEKASKAMMVRMRESRAERGHAGGPGVHMRHHDRFGPHMRRHGRSGAQMRHHDRSGPRMRRHDRPGAHMQRGADKHDAHMGEGSCGEGMGRQLRRHNPGMEKDDCTGSDGKHDGPRRPHPTKQSL